MLYSDLFEHLDRLFVSKDYYPTEEDMIAYEESLNKFKEDNFKDSDKILECVEKLVDEMRKDLGNNVSRWKIWQN